MPLEDKSTTSEVLIHELDRELDEATHRDRESTYRGQFNRRTRLVEEVAARTARPGSERRDAVRFPTQADAILASSHTEALCRVVDVSRTGCRIAAETLGGYLGFDETLVLQATVDDGRERTSFEFECCFAWIRRAEEGMHAGLRFLGGPERLGEIRAFMKAAIRAYVVAESGLNRVPDADRNKPPASFDDPPVSWDADTVTDEVDTDVE